ncbi:MAG: hypothetical protein EHM17_15205 [Verrucomicrobiaceae bacterium]|nr:MAG: hypothetical protein EHM17_15205 [Verrucomicrobiaceae bacterium]
MRGRFHGVILAAILICVAAGQAAAQAVLNPPFGLRWGDSPEKLITWASRHSLDLTISLPGDQPGLRVLKIQPRKGFLPETKAGAVEGRFLGGRLYELTVHYFDPEASADLMEARFEELRKQVASEHGALRANQQQRAVEDQFVTRTQSFHREPVKGLFLLLAYTEVEDLLRKSKDARFSLIYRNDNFRKELEEELKKPCLARW